MNDSIWAVIAGVAKTYNLPFDYVLHNMSYANLILYGAVIPSYKPKDKTGKHKNVIKADDPRNRDKVRKFLESIE